jgi:hypothetical protein
LGTLDVPVAEFDWQHSQIIKPLNAIVGLRRHAPARDVRVQGFETSG